MGLDFQQEDEEDQQSQHSDSRDVGDVIDQLAKLTLEAEQKQEPETQEELIEQTLDETTTIEKVILEISEYYRQRVQVDEVGDPDESAIEESQVDAGESSETSLKKPASGRQELDTLQIPHRESVIVEIKRH